MPENLLIPSVDLRIGALEEYNRRQKQKPFAQKKQKVRPCITLSREFGCEGYPAAELLRDLMMQKTGEEWVLIDRAILEEVARRHNISEDILKNLGEKNHMLDEILATFSDRWKSHYDYFRLLCRHVVSLAEQGNVIILELGGAVIARHLEHSCHFRLYGSMPHKIGSIARRLSISDNEAREMIEREQKRRDRFNTDFLGCNGHDPALYDILFNNDRNSAVRIAHAIAGYIMSA